MPWPNGTTPPRISATMPSDTSPLPAAIVTRKVSHFGASQPAMASNANAATPPSTSRMSAGRSGKGHIFLAWMRWNRPSGRNISTTAITT